MSILDDTKKEFALTCGKRAVDMNRPVNVYPLSDSEAIGDSRGDFAIREGKEYVIEARFENARGQAFTDMPRKWSGTLEELLSLEFSNAGNRGIFVAAANAVLRYIELATGTVSCRDQDQVTCGTKITRELAVRFGFRRIGLVGLQFAILKALTSGFGPEAVRVIDLDPDNVGFSKYGVQIWDGHTDLPRLVSWSDAGLVAGSSIVNGTIDEIIRRFQHEAKPLVFFGNTISGAAALLGLDHLCPLGR